MRRSILWIARHLNETIRRPGKSTAPALADQLGVEIAPIGVGALD
jgi:hypothetical protein